MRQNRHGEAFSAIDRQGRPYLLTPVYRPTVEGAVEPPAGRPAKTPLAEFLGLLAADGRDVRRAAKGRYFVSAEGGEIALFSSDRKAV